MLKNKFIAFLIIVLILLVPAFAAAQGYKTTAEIPNPKVQSGGSVSNPDEILAEYDTDSLNRMLDELESKTGVETAVVVIHDFDETQNDFDFAVSIFKQWGIGKKKADNGLLLLVATDRKKYRFITGYGLEGLLTDMDLKRIGESELVPAFKEQQYGEGVLNAMGVIAAYLEQPTNHKELESLLAMNKTAEEDWQIPVAISMFLVLVLILAWRFMKKLAPVTKEIRKDGFTIYEKIATSVGVGMVLMVIAGIFISAFTGFSWLKSIQYHKMPWFVYGIVAVLISLRYLGALGIIRKSHQDDFNFSTTTKKFLSGTWWCVFMAPPVAIIWAVETRRQQSFAKRFASPEIAGGKPMERVDRDINISGAPYLTAGQSCEESLDVYHYDIWLAKDDTTQFNVIQNKADNYNNHENCPKCGFRTFKKPEVITLKQPTYTREGSGKKVQQCVFCGYELLIKNVVIPTLSDSSSSSSSGGGSSSSSSGSSSYGGGSTGGGGAGGSW